MYKDKDKQREANAERQRRYKAKQKALLSEGVTDESITFVTPEGKSVTFTEGEDDPGTPKRGKDIKALPSKVIPCDTPLKEYEDMHPGLPASVPTLKRGKDVKCFGDLPEDVQQTILTLSTIDGVIDQSIKANRTAIAINYQHLFPDRYHSVGVV